MRCTLLDTGVEQQNQDLIKQGVAKLCEAIAAGDAEAMVLLGEALYAGRGMPENTAEALTLAKKAEALGHPEAFFWRVSHNSFSPKTPTTRSSLRTRRLCREKLWKRTCRAPRFCST